MSERERKSEREGWRGHNANDKSETKIGAWRQRDKRLTKAADTPHNMKGLQAQMVPKGGGGANYNCNCGQLPRGSTF